jgi:hypothetical protein
MRIRGKHKGLVNYNRNHGTSALKEHICHEHLDTYKKWGLFFWGKVVDFRSLKKCTKKKKINSSFSNHKFFW